MSHGRYDPDNPLHGYLSWQEVAPSRHPFRPEEAAATVATVVRTIAAQPHPVTGEPLGPDRV